MSQETTNEFGWLRSKLWPVHAFELKKLIPMLIMAFCVSFNYTILRDTKDTLVQEVIGASGMPFLKLWGTVPCAIVFMLIYSKLSNILSKEKLFYVTIAPFIVFFGLFPIAIYPNRELFELASIANLGTHYIPVLAPLFLCIKHWTASIFYIFSELWGSAVLSLMFWGFANEIVKTTEAKRFYTLFTLGFNVALMFCGPLIIFFAKMNPTLSKATRWQISLNYTISAFIVGALAILACYWWMNRNVLTDKRFYDPENMERKTKKSKPKMSIMESIKFLAGSKYLRCVAILVIGYGMSINLIEVVWKSHIKMLYPDNSDYQGFMGLLSTVTGVVTVCMTFVGGNIIRNSSWRKAAILTPIAVLVTGTLFFVFILFKDSMEPYAGAIGTTALTLAVYIGLAQNVISKSTKYALFDPTKEMSYIPLDQESKVKGKAAIDVVGARLGKSGGAAFYNIMIPLMSGLAFVTPYAAIFTIGVVGAWVGAVGSLGKQYNELTGEGEEASTEPATAKA